MSDATETAISFEALLPRHAASLMLEHNDHKGVYCSVEEHYGDDCWVSDEERLKAIATDNVWVLHWYPDTPVGFYRVAASSLPSLLAHVSRRIAEGEFQ